MNTLILFDIDKTLVKSNTKPTTHEKAFSSAIKEVYGIDTEVEFIDHVGLTDQQIVRGLLQQVGLTDEEIELRFSKCLDLMGKYYWKNIKEGELEALAGARELLERLHGKAMLGLVTGNLETIALQKLDRTDLSVYFKFGAYGSDDPERSALVEIAIKKAEALGFKPDKVFLVGDTIRDVKAGKASGAKVVAVVGGSSSEELKKAGADVVLENLADTEKLVSMLLG